MISFATPDSYDENEPATDVPSFSQLLGAARRGCPVARDALCNRMSPFVRRRAERMIPARLQAKFDPEDLAQDVLLDFFRGFTSLAGHQEAQIRAWLCRATVNRGRDLLRRYGRGGKRDVQRERILTLPHENLARNASAARAHNPVQNAILTELWEIVRAEMGRLPKDQRRALELQLDGGQSYTDMARSLGKSGEAARKLCSRARDQLRDQLRARQISA